MMILPFAYHTVIRERFTDPVEMRTECAHDRGGRNDINAVPVRDESFPPM